MMNSLLGALRSLTQRSLVERTEKIAFSPDGQFLATGNANCEVHLW
jgi:WD40 repeat protein